MFSSLATGFSPAAHRSSSPLAGHANDLARPIAEERPSLASAKQLHSDEEDADEEADEEEDEDVRRRPDRDDETDGDVEDIDVELDNSNSPLLVEKRNSVGEAKGKARRCGREKVVELWSNE